jgi:hypothetical protein
MIADFLTDIDTRLSDWIRGGKVHTGEINGEHIEFLAGLRPVYRMLG